MAIYEYKCDNCNTIWTTTQYGRESSPCPDCTRPIRRLFSFAIAKSMPDHFNDSVGRYVTNKRDLSDELKRKSEDAMERTGIPHDFQFGDLRDKDLFGVTGEGLEDTFNAHAPASDTRATITKHF